MGLAIRRGRVTGAATGATYLAGLLLSSLFASAAAQGSTEPSPAVPPGGEVVTLGADTLILEEPFDSGDRWGLAQDANGSITYADGALHVAIDVAPSAKWTWTQLGQAEPVLWMRAAVALSPAGGAAGPMCGSAGDPPAFLFGVVNTSDEWVLGRAFQNALTVVSRGPLPASSGLSGGGEAVVSLECAMTGTGGDRVAMWVDGVNVADVTFEQADGPFALAGLLGEGYAVGFDARIDDVAVATGAAYAPLVRVPAGGSAVPAASLLPLPAASLTPVTPTATPSAAAPPVSSPAPLPVASPVTPGASAVAVDDLLGHIPSAISANCAAVAPDPVNGLVAVVQCAPAGDLASAAYFRYATADELEAAFDQLLEHNAAVTDGSDCSVGPGLVEYTIGDATAGRLACYLLDGTVVVQWTNRDLGIMGFGADPSGDFAKAFAWWQNAGPLS
jgi:hypothetical protein